MSAVLDSETSVLVTSYWPILHSIFVGRNQNLLRIQHVATPCIAMYPKPDNSTKHFVFFVEKRLRESDNGIFQCAAPLFS